MIATIFRISWTQLRRDRVALALTFLLPLVFFSVFAAAFAGLDPGSRPEVATVVVVDPHGAFGARIAERLAAEQGLTVEQVPPSERDEALASVRRGRVEAVVVLPAEPGEIELYADRANPMAAGIVEGLVRSTAAGILFSAPAELASLPVRVIDPLGRTGKRPSIAFFASGLGVMFLLFAVTGRSSILIDERESGVLGRLAASELGLTRLLVGRWLFLAVVGATQVALMFVWAALVFGLDLFGARQLAGFALVTSTTAAAAAAFGLLLSTLCRTRAQLSGVAVVVVLALSAVGGSMFPSFLMPEGVQAVGRWAFNAWALEAYQKIFWYEQPVLDLWPQAALLAGATAVFFSAAAVVARRTRLAGGLA